MNIKNIFKKSNMKYGIGGLDKDINQFTLTKVKNYVLKYIYMINLYYQYMVILMKKMF